MKDFEIWQIKDSRWRDCDYTFRAWAFAEISGFTKNDYEMVWSGMTNKSLDGVFSEFNINHPQDFKGHSLSVSDVVVIDGKAWYCDSVGWKEITDKWKA